LPSVCIYAICIAGPTSNIADVVLYNEMLELKYDVANKTVDPNFTLGKPST
jgi:hypothetical protein